MTIINSFVQGDCAYLLTDTAWLENGTGRILASETKIIRGTNFPWAIAVTGDAHVAQLANQINWRAPADAEELAMALPGLLSGLRSLSSDDSFTMAVRLAAWCATTMRPRVFHIDTDAHRAALYGWRPWELMECEVIVPGERSLPTLMAIAQSGEQIMDPSRFDVRRDGLRMIEAQRQFERGPVKGRADPVAVIGCSAELACVSPFGVTVETLHTWAEDRIGAMIEPERALEAA